jgi:hypothetical protein
MQMRANQYNFFKVHFPTIARLAALRPDIWDSYTDNWEEARTHHADPHDKRLLRIQAYEDMTFDNRMYQESWAYNAKPVWYKIKKDELAKHGKYARAIGDLTVPVSLQGFKSAEYMKKHLHAVSMDGDINFNDIEVMVCIKSDDNMLNYAFKKLFNPPGRGFLVVFSDDACLAIRINKEVKWFNLDIKSCDASMMLPIFMYVLATGPPHNVRDTYEILKQLHSPFVVRDPSDPRTKVIYKLVLEFFFEYSGHAYTSAINKQAFLSIIHSISREDIKTEEDIVRAGYIAGFALEVTACHIFESLQFLKKSPVMCGGEYKSVINLGVILRASGSCKGTPPGRTKIPIDVRCQTFQALLVNGIYPNIHSPLIDAMRRQITTKDDTVIKNAIGQIQKNHKWLIGETQLQTIHITDEDLLRRYQLTSHQVEELYDFANASYGDVIVNSALAKVLATDYDLDCRYVARERLLTDNLLNNMSVL